MPCQFCKSVLHTLTNCPGDISESKQVIEYYIGHNPFNLVEQYDVLRTFPKSVLALLNKRIGSGVSGTKLFLIENIIKLYFSKRYLLPMNQSLQLQDTLVEEYHKIQMWDRNSSPKIYLFRCELMMLLDNYYTRVFRYSYAELLYNEMIARQQLQINPKAHLKKLEIGVQIDTTLKAQECFMCCSEDKNHARLGCNHEYCVDCVYETAKVRTKSFITCAICRSDIKEINVETQEIAYLLHNKLIVE